jgi:hypothetical protein
MFFLVLSDLSIGWMRNKSYFVQVPTGSFTRLLTGPSFYLSWATEGDLVPPRRITDLTLGPPRAIANPNHTPMRK